MRPAIKTEDKIIVRRGMDAFKNGMASEKLAGNWVNGKSRRWDPSPRKTKGRIARQRRPQRVENVERFPLRSLVRFWGRMGE